MLRSSLAAAVGLWLISPWLPAQVGIAINSPNGEPLSERVVAYTIDARLDTDRKTLDATETLTYRNLTGQPLNTFPFHLYLNAFRPESTFTAETRAGGGIRDSLGDHYPAEKIGSIMISHIEADGYGDLTPTLHFTAPDDGNLLDHTVAEVILPRPLAPNDSITFHVAFHDKFPLSVARNGYKRDFIMGGQWFPKVGVFWHGAWNCHQYHATTEFFSDFGTYNVRLTVPRRYVVGASGVSTGNQPNSDGTKTLSFYGEDIHDFAFAASPHFIPTDAIYLSSLGPVQIHILALAAHPHIGQRYLDIMRGSLREFERRYGPYPYKVITVIDPEPGSEMEGMEYPTLVTGDGSWTSIFKVPEITVEHEFGHQYWYGMVATNEFEEAWLDEGINSYTEVKVLAALLGDRTSVVQQRYANFGDGSLQRITYLSAPDFDPVTRFAWKFRDEHSYGAITYGKTATLLTTLEGILGTNTMDEALRTYFQRYRFKHPTGEDFLRTIEEVAVARGKASPLSGEHPEPAPVVTTCAPLSPLGPTTTFRQLSQPTPTCIAEPAPAPANAYTPTTLRPFIQQAVYGTQLLDYSVDGFSSEPVQWWQSPPRDPRTTQYSSVVYLRRQGDFILPVTAEIVFDDGSRVREHWDGTDRWTRFTYTRNAKVVSVELDPDHLIPLDRNLFNNSYTNRIDKVPAHKLASIWTVLQQMAAQLAAWIV
ncbi:M1 family metallopeptidase [Edaphobacter albus]|uniref:M1 family metallopeptidase n=1 Tax=Edaphobacter sp. 4G125 TaxID=2763071 RepID=UPI001648FE8D|nr:M1 family metallopeptidase [Edaphobacter sp. 4G125]QNI36182.1 M1 family metallopeptidase [Edaphobacter sp. 4G125]